MTNLNRMRKRVNRAISKKEQNWNKIYDDIYKFVLPYRDADATIAEGQSRVDCLFDGTAPNAAFRFAGRLQSDVTPPFQSNFTLEPGPVFEEPGTEEAKKELAEELELVGKRVHAVISSGLFHTASHEMYFDLFAGTGCMLMLEGDDEDIVDFVSVPFSEVTLEKGPKGKVWGIIWQRRYAIEELEDMWPKGTFSDALRRKMKEDDKAEDEIEIIQYTRFDRETKRWNLTVFERGKDGDEAGEKPIWEEQFRTNPWLTPRFFVVPGEAHGRGPAMLALPFVKTLNKARELTLKAAAFALLGLWVRRNDSVFNPDTARMEPGAMWAVGSTGGPLGPTFQRLDVPKEFDVSTIVVEEERAQVKTTTFDDTLPPDSGAVRSPTEIVERLKRLAQDLGGVYGRLTLEIIKPLVQRVIDIMEKKKLLSTTNLTIDQLLVQIKVTSPIAQSQQAVDLQRLIDWITIIAEFAGPQGLAAFSNLTEALLDAGRMLGVAEKYIPSKAESEKRQKDLAEVAAAQAAPPTQATPPTEQEIAA